MIQKGLFGAVALAAGFATPAASIVYLMQTDDEMVRQSPVIVYGQVVGTAPARLGGRPATDAEVRVEKVLQGWLPGSVVTVRQPGGVGSGMLHVVMGLPMLSEGDRVLLFLEEHEEVHRTVGLGLGVFFEASYADRRILVREAPHLASGRVAEERAVRDSARFRRWITDRAAGRASRADYLAADPPNRPRSVTSRFVLFGKASNHYCLGENTDFDDPDSVGGRKKIYMVPRWKRFDTGGTLTFRAYGLQEGLSSGDANEARKVADTMAGLRAAMSAWNVAAPSVSLAATWIKRDLPEFPDHAPAVIEFGTGPDADPTLSPFALGGTVLAGNCDYDVPGSEHTIPGTNVKASAAAGTTILVTELLAVQLAEVSAGAVNDFVQLLSHELGHALGLAHSNEPGAIMQPSMSVDGHNPGLGTDDVNGIRYLYPSSPGGGPPSGGGGAPPPEPPPEPDPPPPPPPPPPPQVNATFEPLKSEVEEGAIVSLAVRLDADPERTVTLPLVVTQRDGTTDADYSGVPDIVTFQPGVTSVTFEFAAIVDSEEDYGESVAIGFGSLPPRVTGTTEAIVSILDDDTPPRAGFQVNAALYDETEDLYRVRTGDLVRFVSTSTGPVSSFGWDFGDGTQSGLATFDHAWLRPGFYDVTLRVDDGGERDSSLSRTFLVEAGEPRGTCTADSETTCLQDGRYQVQVDWRTGDGESGAGRVVHAGTNDSGLFSFFGRDNWEILVKVLNGCSINGHHWVYAAAATDLGYVIRVIDTATGESKEYRNEAGELASAVVDAAAFSSRCETPAVPAGGAVPSGGETLLLGDGRFEVGIEWSTEDDRGVARSVRPRTEDSGLFWFFEPTNWEVLVKVLDGCAINGHHWVYAASATNLPFEMTITDAETGEVYRYAKAPDELAALADPAAFANSCQAGR